MSEDIINALRMSRRVSFAVVVPAQLLAVKLYALGWLAGTDMTAPIALISGWLIRRGDVVDGIASVAIFVELLKVTRIDLSGQLNFAANVLLLLMLTVMMMLMPGFMHIFSCKLAWMSLGCTVVSPILRTALARRDISVGT